MQSVYIVVENGESYQVAYPTFKAAVKAVKEKHKELLEERIQELKDLDLIEEVLADINVPEDTTTNVTNLYIEKGINIKIHKLAVEGR